MNILKMAIKALHRHALVTSLLLGVSVSSAQADTYYWSGTNNWSNSSNWTPVGLPGPNDTAVIGTNMVTLSDPVVVGALIISNKATMVFSNWTTSLTASNVTILGGGTVTSAPAFLNNAMSNRVWFICTNFLVSSGGVINVDGAGYQWCNGPGAGSTIQYGAGGGHGGHGGTAFEAQLGGASYGASNAPMTPGSGGGYTTNGGNGGGVITILATETATVVGVISASGAPSSSIGKGGGAGGSIFISCNVFAGNTNGLLRANGGNGNVSGSPGGGGRIAVIYDSTAQAGINPGVRFSTARGINGFSYNVLDPARDSQDGTLFLPDRSFISETIRYQLFNGVRLFIPGFTNWAPNNLTLSNNCVMTFGPDGFQLTVSNKLLLADNSGLGVNLVNGELNCGSLVLTNNGKLWVYSGATNVNNPDYAALVKIAGDVTIGSNSWIYPYSDSTTGGSILFRMSNLTVAAAGGFDANNKGYISNKGLGHGIFKTTHGSGAGYGEKGGSSATTNGGSAYGSADTPIDPGSGGGPAFMGGGAATDLVGGMGGGLIRIQAAGNVTLNGILTANAQDGWSAGASRYGGGGAGGGIFVICSKFTGNSSGFIRANGGVSTNTVGSGAGGGGGGGRIAVWQGVPEDAMAQYLASGNSHVVKSSTLAGYSGATSVASGVGYTNLPPVGAESGTQWFFIWIPSGGTLLMVQ